VAGLPDKAQKKMAESNHLLGTAEAKH